MYPHVVGPIPKYSDQICIQGLLQSKEYQVNKALVLISWMSKNQSPKTEAQRPKPEDWWPKPEDRRPKTKAQTPKIKAQRLKTKAQRPKTEGQNP